MSTDDEFDSNTPLPDHIRLNKATCSGVRAKNSGCKQFKQNTRKKTQKQCSKNHSTALKLPTNNQWMISETPSPYFIGPKKRQSVDKVEQTAHPKRTCLSDRFFISTQNQRKQKNGCVDLLRHKQSDESPKPLFPNVRFTLGSKSYMEPTASFNDISEHGSYQPSAATYNVPDMETPSSSSASSSCSSNNQSYSFNKTDASLDDSLVRPSTSNYEQDVPKQKNGTSLCKSNALGVNFIDSENDDSEVHLTIPPANGDRYQFCPLGKVIGKGLRKVLESDDDNDSDDSVEDAHFPNNYRRRGPLISSDSDDSSDIPVVAKKSFKKRNLLQLSSTDSNDGSASSFIVYSPTHSCTSGLSKKSSSERSSDCSRSKNTRDHSYALRDVTREHTNSSSLSSSTSHSSKNRYPTTRAASKRYTANSSSLSSSTSLSSQSNTSSSSADRNTRYPHRDSSVRQAISPLTLRVTRSRYQAGLSRSAMVNQSSNGQQAHRRVMDLSAQYPDVLDPEESSELEFFTANSYSDTEASISTVESLGEHNIAVNTSARSYPNNITYSVSASSPSEDEISVIFTTGSAFPDSTSRRTRHRGGGGRRRRTTRGPPRAVSLNSTQDLTSVSPDPVEQVRQMEEDEQFARMLQAQFDAEIIDRGEGNEAEEIFETSHVSIESDTESIHGSLESMVDTEIVPFPPPRGASGITIRPILTHPTRGSSRFAVPSNIMFLGGGRRRRGRRSHSVQGDPWMYQFARVLGLSPAYTSPDESEYETLLHFAETIGEEVPRGLHKTEINRLPTRKFYFPGAGPSTSHGHEDIVHKRTDLNKECQVCLSDYENGDVLRILPCFHEFHTPCIDPWLKINHTCPVCRVEVAFEQENLL